MNLRKSTIFKKFPSLFIVFITFVVVHILLFNVNVAEWGDSYRILRGAEEIRKGVYPEDEKRPPLFSAVLSERPQNIDPVTWGRVVMFFVSMGTFFVFYGLLSQFVSQQKYRILGMVLFSLNPVFLYWSIRIMADVPFAFIVLLSFYLYQRWRDSLRYWQCILLGLLAGASVIMRFEGFLLIGSLGLGIFFSDLKGVSKRISLFVENKCNLGKNIDRKFMNASTFAIGTLSILIPYILYRNPFGSSYFEEPSGREYDLKMVLTYIASLLFAFGYVSASGVLIARKKSILRFLSNNIGMMAFLIVELLLTLLWPAAIPRLFVSSIPFLIIMIVLSTKDWFESEKVGIAGVLLVGCLPFLYVFSQYLLGLQFLVMTKKLILLISLLQIPVTTFLLIRKYKHFFFSMVLSMLTWSFLVIWAHKDIFISVKRAAEYSIANLTGTFGYNDLSSVSNFYLNYLGSPKTKGKYYSLDNGSVLTEEFVRERDLDYLIITNEHNLGLEIDYSKRPYLKVLKEFRYNVNGANFKSDVIQVNKEQL